MEGTYIADFLYNQLIDTLILWLVKEKEFPEREQSRIWMGGLFSSLTYVVWKYRMILRIAGMASLFLSLVIISMILVAVFKISTVIQLFHVWKTVLFYSAVSGGLGILASRLPFPKPHLFLMFLIPGLLSVFLIFFSVNEKRERFYRRRNHNIYRVRIQRGKTTIDCAGLYDSGNQLVSRLTGQGVLVISYASGLKLLSEEERKKFLDGRSAAGDSLYTIHYHSISEKQGFLTGILADRITVYDHGSSYVRERGMIGISDGLLCADNRYNVLLPEDIFSDS